MVVSYRPGGLFYMKEGLNKIHTYTSWGSNPTGDFLQSLSKCPISHPAASFQDLSRNPFLTFNLRIHHTYLINAPYVFLNLIMAMARAPFHPKYEKHLHMPALFTRIKEQVSISIPLEIWILKLMLLKAYSF